jgi:hypothetical protein
VRGESRLASEDLDMAGVKRRGRKAASRGRSVGEEAEFRAITWEAAVLN